MGAVLIGVGIAALLVLVVTLYQRSKAKRAEIAEEAKRVEASIEKAEQRAEGWFNKEK